MKRIYLVKRTDPVNYDEYDAVVVVARTLKEAKELAIKDEDYYGSFTNENTVCILIGVANKRQPFGEVLASYNAG